MQDKIELSPADQKKWLEEMHQRFLEELEKLPEISDEEFMAEFEVSDEEYRMGFVLPGIGHDEEE